MILSVFQNSQQISKKLSIFSKNLSTSSKILSTFSKILSIFSKILSTFSKKVSTFSKQVSVFSKKLSAFYEKYNIEIKKIFEISFRKLGLLIVTSWCLEYDRVHQLKSMDLPLFYILFNESDKCLF